MAAALGIANHVEFLGFVKDPYPVIISSDVYVMSSRWEGLPTSLIEAMTCGVPVVSTRAKYGPEEIIENEKCGLLVDVGDSEAIAEAIHTIITDKALGERLSRAGIERVRSKFSKDALMWNLQTLFVSTLEDTCHRLEDQLSG